MQKPLQSQPFTMQIPCTTKTGHIQSGTQSRQGDGHGHHGSTRLHQQGQHLLQDTNTYKVLKKDPTNSLKNKLITILKDIKQSGGLNNTKYKQQYPTSAFPPNSMAFPKSIELAPPLDP